MDEILRIILDFGVNVVLAYLIPSAILGLILKAQKKRRVYPHGPEGEQQLKRDANVGLVGINGIFMLWSFVNWPGSSTYLLRGAVVVFSLAFYFNHPLSIIAVPDSTTAILRWLSGMVGTLLESIPWYRDLKMRVFAGKMATQTTHHAFSGPEIESVWQQLLLSQTRFTCHMCGLEKDNGHLGDVLLDENKQALYFCDETSCRIEARNLLAKMSTAWKRKMRGVH